MDMDLVNVKSTPRLKMSASKKWKSKSKVKKTGTEKVIIKSQFSKSFKRGNSLVRQQSIRKKKATPVIVRVDERKEIRETQQTA